jgi:hypothetical protein
MKSLRLGLLVLCAVLLSPAVFAGSFTPFSGKLSFIATDWLGAGFIFGITGVPGPCAFGQFSMNASAPGYKDQVAVLLLAWSTGQTVTVVQDSTDSCPNSRANIIAVQIGP